MSVTSVTVPLDIHALVPAGRRSRYRVMRYSESDGLHRFSVQQRKWFFWIEITVEYSYVEAVECIYRHLAVEAPPVNVFEV